MRKSAETRARMSAARQKMYEPPCSREKLVRLYVDEGMTQAEIATHLGLTQKRIHTAMRLLEIPRRVAAKRDQSGSANSSWKGTDASYKAKHQRVAALRGSPRECEPCGENDGTKMYDWANITGDYDDEMDYVRACRPCHRLIDANSYPRDPRTGRFLPKGGDSNA